MPSIIGIIPSAVLLNYRRINHALYYYKQGDDKKDKPSLFRRAWDYPSKIIKQVREHQHRDCLGYGKTIMPIKIPHFLKGAFLFHLPLLLFSYFKILGEIPFLSMILEAKIRKLKNLT